MTNGFVVEQTEVTKEVPRPYFYFLTLNKGPRTQMIGVFRNPKPLISQYLGPNPTIWVLGPLGILTRHRMTPGPVIPMTKLFAHY